MDAEAVETVAGNRYREVKLVNPTCIIHRGQRRRRVCIEGWRNLGSPTLSSFGNKGKYLKHKCSEHKVLETECWMAESAVVVRKEGNASGAKG